MATFTQLAAVVIPYADYHRAFVSRALASVEAQAYRCQTLVIEDNRKRGTGWARNQGLQQSRALFTIFLDADDTLEPDFLDKTLAVWRRGTYVYVDDWQGESLHQTPDSGVYRDGSWHVVTTLLPTAFALAVGGFDETLPALEDKDFYLKVQAAGVKPLRCKAPLVRYTPHGKRSKNYPKDDPAGELNLRIQEKYAMACCGEQDVTIQAPTEHQEGDTLVQAVGAAQYQSLQGPMTGRWYKRPKSTHGYRIYVDPRDQAARPEWWQPVTRILDPTELSPDVDFVRRLAEEALTK